MTREDLWKVLDEQHHGIVQSWLDRGDGVCVYENVKIGHPNSGHQKFVPTNTFKDDPPTRMPDMNGQINWRYTLKAIVQ